MNRMWRWALAGLVLVYLSIGALQYLQFRATELSVHRGDVHGLWSFQRVAVEQYRLEADAHRYLRSPTPAALEALQMRYEVLLSGLDAIKVGTPHALMHSDPHYAQLLEAKVRFTQAGDALLAQAALQPEQAVIQLLAHLQALAPVVNEAVLAANREALLRQHDIRH